MKTIFVNFTNHPSSQWEEVQLNEAKKYGDIVDIPFPVIDPKINNLEIKDLAKDYVDKIVNLDAEIKVVHIMGEMTFTFCVVNMLQKLGIQCVASTTRRDTIIADDGSKISKFHFEQFRPYFF